MYPLFADTETGIYPHVTSLYARPKATRGITMLSMDKSHYKHKQTRDNEFSSSSNDVHRVHKRLKVELPCLSGLNRYINTVVLRRIKKSEEVSGGRVRHGDVINVPFPLYLTLMASKLIQVSNSQSEARVGSARGWSHQWPSELLHMHRDNHHMVTLLTWIQPETTIQNLGPDSI